MLRVRSIFCRYELHLLIEYTNCVENGKKTLPILIIVITFVLRKRGLTARRLTIRKPASSKPLSRRDARVTEWAGLEIRKAACPLRGFESLSLRKKGCKSVNYVIYALYYTRKVSRYFLVWFLGAVVKPYPCHPVDRSEPRTQRLPQGQVWREARRIGRRSPRTPHRRIRHPLHQLREIPRPRHRERTS